MEFNEIEDKAVIVLRDWLRKYLTDPKGRANSSWIFKSEPVDPNNTITYPRIIIDLSSADYTPLNLPANRFYARLTFDLNIWAETIAHRDQITQQIFTLLKDEDKVDELGWKLESISTRTDDSYLTDKPEIYRHKLITLTFSL